MSLLLTCTALPLHAQTVTTVSVPFPVGGLGPKGSSWNAIASPLTFSTLDIRTAYFSQETTTGQFEGA